MEHFISVCTEGVIAIRKRNKNEPNKKLYTRPVGQSNIINVKLLAGHSFRQILKLCFFTAFFMLCFKQILELLDTVDMLREN